MIHIVKKLKIKVFEKSINFYHYCLHWIHKINNLSTMSYTKQEIEYLLPELSSNFEIIQLTFKAMIVKHFMVKHNTTSAIIMEILKVEFDEARKMSELLIQKFCHERVNGSQINFLELFKSTMRTEYLRIRNDDNDDKVYEHLNNSFPSVESREKYGFYIDPDYQEKSTSFEKRCIKRDVYLESVQNIKSVFYNNPFAIGLIIMINFFMLCRFKISFFCLIITVNVIIFFVILAFMNCFRHSYPVKFVQQPVQYVQQLVQYVRPVRCDYVSRPDYVSRQDYVFRSDFVSPHDLWIHPNDVNPQDLIVKN